MPSSQTWLVALAILALSQRILKSRPLPSRETIIKPDAERVVLLGASSGVGRDLALAYSKRRARLLLFARRRDVLEQVKQECLALGAADVIVVHGDITSPSHLVAVRERVIDEWQGLDTLHILAGVPSTSTLLDIAGAPLAKATSGNHLATKAFTTDTQIDNLQKVVDEARACSEINFIGTTLALATFLPLLSKSKSPVLHHLSSVAATIPAPRRTIYAATKAAALMAVESCRVECEGIGVRFFSLLPGTIDNGFRLKTATSQTGGNCEVQGGVKHSYENLLLAPEQVVATILQHLAINPSPAPLIPYFPFDRIDSIRIPPRPVVHIPWLYRLVTFIGGTPLGWLWVEPAARKKYAI